jgi:hypothetical protein
MTPEEIELAHKRLLLRRAQCRVYSRTHRKQMRHQVKYGKPPPSVVRNYVKAVVWYRDTHHCFDPDPDISLWPSDWVRLDDGSWLRQP